MSLTDLIGSSIRVVSGQGSPGEASLLDRIVKSADGQILTERANRFGGGGVAGKSSHFDGNQLLILFDDKGRSGDSTFSFGDHDETFADLQLRFDMIIAIETFILGSALEMKL